MTFKMGISGDEKLWKQFQEYCQSKGYDASKRVMILIKEDMEKNAK